MTLDSEITRELIDTAKALKLKCLTLFGSRARDDCCERSDIDLAAYFNSSSQYFNFCDQIEEINTPLMFDVIDLSSDMIDLDLRKSIEEEGVLLYEEI